MKLDIHFEFLNKNNIGKYIAYLEIARSEEPDMMTIDELDIRSLKERIYDPFYNNTSSLLALEKDTVVGWLEHHFYGCIQDGYRMAYIDWLYVLKDYRHNGITQMLFKEFEKQCVYNKINQYFLIEATNENAKRFYQKFRDAEFGNEIVLRKNIKSEGYTI